MASDKTIFNLFVLKHLFDIHYGRNRPTELIQFIMTLMREPAVQIMCDSRTTIILHRPTGVVYASGSNHVEQFGMCANKFSGSSILKKVELPNKIKSININSPILYARNTENELFYWGCEWYQDVRLSMKSQLFVSDIYLPNTISHGYNYKLFLGRNNNLYIQGDNKYMGINRNQGLQVVIFPICSQNFKIIQIGSNTCNSFVLTTSGLYGWGQNNRGQLGLGDESKHYDPIKMNLDLTVMSFSLGEANIVVLDKNNDVWVWGKNNYGQLGLGDLTDVLIPCRHSLKNIVAVECGAWHTLARSSNGDVYSWGSNGCGQLGLGAMDCVLLPKKITLTHIVSIACGPTCSIVVDSNDKIWVWGDNQYGQLGLGDKLCRSVPHELKFEF